MTELNHISRCNLNHLNHDFKHIKLSIFECNICNVSIIFTQDYKYWKMNKYEYSTELYETNCNEQCIKALLE